MKSIAILSTWLIMFSLITASTPTPTSTSTASHSSSDSDDECKAWLVQSIPTDMPHLPLIPGVLSTANVFKWIAGNATRKLDIMAQYWQLVPGSDNPLSGDYGYSEENMTSFGAEQGFSVYKAIENAANRSVVIRLLQHSGVYPDYTKEPSDIASAGPSVTNVTLLLSNWFGSGIIHAKVWIADDRHVYIGSANNDWKSLSQVKEAGIYIADCHKIAKKVRKYYNNLWTLASLNATLYTTTVWDSQSQLNRTVPCWSHFIPKDDRCDSPLPDYVKVKHVTGYPSLSDPDMFKKSLQTPGCEITSTTQRYKSYLSFAPPELSFDDFQTDEQAWVDTIKSVGSGGTVRINTMDWLGQSQFTEQTVYWSALSSAISEVVFSKQATVQLIVARWAHFIHGTDAYLKSLLYTNVLCQSSAYNHCSGKVEIKYYVVPGYNSTGPALSNDGNTTSNLYPSYTRVNHGKYAVSDVRAHIGTSNLVWDYFYTTAGVGFGTYNPSIVSQLQQIFDADWYSPYAYPVEPIAEGYSYTS